MVAISYFFFKKLIFFILLEGICLFYGVKTKKYSWCLNLTILLAVSALTMLFPAAIFLLPLVVVVLISILVCQYVKIPSWLKGILLFVLWLGTFCSFFVMIFLPIPARRYDWQTFQHEAKTYTVLQISDSHTAFANQ